MAKRHVLLPLGTSILLAKPASACEPVVPFMQVMMPALALSGSILILAVAVVLKSALFAIFERQLPRFLAAWRMFLGNVLTSFVGLLVAVLIASAPSFWFIERHWSAFFAGCHHGGSSRQPRWHGWAECRLGPWLAP